MSSTPSDGSPLERAAGVAGPAATDAFSVLANETRLAILLALWEAYEPLAEDNALSFSRLRESVGVRDSGQFNYHLDKLSGHFISATEDGYVIREAGRSIVEAVIAGTGLETAALTPTSVALPCNRCGDAATEIRYEDHTLYLTCNECEGFMAAEQFPTGTLAVWPLEPAGLADRTPEEILVAGVITEVHDRRMMEAGVCPACSGTIQSTIRVCEDHDTSPGAVCEECGTRDSARVWYECRVCKHWEGGPIQVLVTDHPDVIRFFDDHGIAIRFDVTDFEGFARQWSLLWEVDHEVLSTDPVRIQVTVPCDGDALHLTLDDEGRVLETERVRAS